MTTTHSPLVPWQDMLQQVSANGMRWKGVAHCLDVCEKTVADFANGNTNMVITFERGLWILHMHKSLCPESFARIAPHVKANIRRQGGYEALLQVMNAED